MSAPDGPGTGEAIPSAAEAMRGRYTDDEWRALHHAPYLTAIAIGMSDPGGPVALVRENRSMRLRVRVARNGMDGALALAVARTMTGDRPTVVELVGPDARRPEIIVDRAVEGVGAAAALTHRAGQDGERFRRWLMDCAIEMARAAHEGAVPGVDRERISAREWTGLRRVAEALGFDPPGPPEEIGG